MRHAEANPIYYRRPGMGRVLALGFPLLKLAAWILDRSPSPAPKGIAIFQAYQIGDFFMALPAIRRAHALWGVAVVCRPDCAFLLEKESIQSLPLSYPAFVSNRATAWWRTFLAAWRLRGKVPRILIDTDADPRTALLARIMGSRHVLSYHRPYGYLMGPKVHLGPARRHQVERTVAMIEAIDQDPPSRALLEREAGMQPDPSGSEHPANPAGSKGAVGSVGRPGKKRHPTILLSCWTSKDTKNWPFEHWDAFLGAAWQRAEWVLLSPPDGDAAYRRFEKDWEARLRVHRSGLPGVVELAGGCDAVMTADSFAGHLGAYCRKPVLWINGSSDADYVKPYGERVRVVQEEPMSCRPCAHRCDQTPYKRCLWELSPERVLAAFERWLAESVAPPHRGKG